MRCCLSRLSQATTVVDKTRTYSLIFLLGYKVYTLTTEMQGVVVTCVKSYMTNCFAGQAMLSIIGPAEYRLAVTDSFAQESVGSLLKENNTSGTCTNTGTLRNEGEQLYTNTLPAITVCNRLNYKLCTYVFCCCSLFY